MQALGSMNVDDQKFTSPKLTYLINWSMSAKDREETAHDLNFFTILLMRGENSDTLSFMFIKGSPKYLMGRKPIEKPKLTTATTSSRSKPAVKNWAESCRCLFLAQTN